MADASDITRWVGVFVACIGAFVVSPAASLLLVSRAVAPVRNLAELARPRLARWLPRLRRSTTVHAVTAHATASFGVATVATGRGWVPSDSAEQKIERLHQHVEQLHDLLGGLRTQINNRLASHDVAIAKVEGDLRDGLQELQDLHAETHRRATETDARALPVVGVGIVLTGIPDELAALPRWLWLPILAIAVALAIWATVAAARDRRSLSR